MRIIDNSEMPQEKRAHKFHMGISIMETGEKWLALCMTDIDGVMMCYGSWPKEDWERMKKDVDSIFEDKDFKIKKLN